MIQLNYPEMLQEIKTGIFIGDHSAIYCLFFAFRERRSTSRKRRVA